MWDAGAIASDGIELMAETGGTSTLRGEIAARIGEGVAEQVISGSGTGALGSVSVEFDASQSFPLVSVVSMLAPSPDWFVGVHDVALYRTGSWVSSVESNLVVYDAGTDSGPSFTSSNSNADITPHIPIVELMGNPQIGLEETNDMNIVGTMRFERIDQ